jgi:hypothetical protein
MLPDITFHESFAVRFLQLIETLKNRFIQRKNRKIENYFLID